MQPDMDADDSHLLFSFLYIFYYIELLVATCSSCNLMFHVQCALCYEVFITVGIKRDDILKVVFIFWCMKRNKTKWKISST